MTDQFIQFTILFIYSFINIFYVVMFLYIILSWVLTRPTPFWALLTAIVRPMLKPFRWARIGMMDFSPLVALLAIDFGGNILIQVLKSFLNT